MAGRSRASSRKSVDRVGTGGDVPSSLASPTRGNRDYMEQKVASTVHKIKQASAPLSPNPHASPSTADSRKLQRSQAHPSHPSHPQHSGGSHAPERRPSKTAHDATTTATLKRDQLDERGAKRQCQSPSIDPNSSAVVMMSQQPGPSGRQPAPAHEPVQTQIPPGSPGPPISNTTSSPGKQLPPQPQPNSGDIEQMEDFCDQLGHQLAEAKRELCEAKEDNKRLQGHISRLQKKVTDTAASRTEGDPLAGSRRPDAEITKPFHSLIYRVHNFVINYYKEPGKQAIKLWVEGESRRLANIHPDFARLAVEKSSAQWFVKALIWNYLLDHVFYGVATSGGAMWAGRYASRLNRLSSSTPLSLSPYTHPSPLLPSPPIKQQFFR